jgi:hypothetical protein
VDNQKGFLLVPLIVPEQSLFQFECAYASGL